MGDVMELRIPLRELANQQDDMSYEIKELWFDFDNEEDNGLMTQVRIKFSYLYNKRMFWEYEMGCYKQYLQEDCIDYNNIDLYLEALQRPYSDILNWKEVRETRIGITFEQLYQEVEESLVFNEKYPNLNFIENSIISTTVGKPTDFVMRSIGFKQTPWLGFTKLLMMVMFFLNAFACYARPDFLT